MGQKLLSLQGFDRFWYEILVTGFLNGGKSGPWETRVDWSDPLFDINSAIKLYEEQLSNDNPLLVKEIMEEDEIRIRREQSERPADIFKSLASGKQRYLKNIEP